MEFCKGENDILNLIVTCLCICFINFAQGLSYKLLIGWHSRVVVSSLLPEISKACCIFLSTKRMYLNYLWIRVARKCNNRFKSLAKDWVILARFLSISFWPLFYSYSTKSMMQWFSKVYWWTFEEIEDKEIYCKPEVISCLLNFSLFSICCIFYPIFEVSNYWNKRTLWHSIVLHRKIFRCL